MSELDTAVNVNSGGRTPVKSPSSPRSDDDHSSSAAPHPHHDKIILGLMIATILMVCLWLIMLWAPESNDEAYQSVVTRAAGGFTTTLVFLGATIVLVMWSARSGGNGAIAAAAAVASIIFTMYFYTVPFRTEFANTSKKSATRDACSQTFASAVQLQTCQYWDGEAAGWCLVWICQLAWTAYGVFIAYTTRNTGMRALVGDYGKAGVFGVGLGLLGYFLYWACSMAVSVNYTDGGAFWPADPVLQSLGFWHTMGIAASLASMVYWLFGARHMLEDVLILNAIVLFYYLSTLVWSVRRIAGVVNTSDAPCGGKYTPIGGGTEQELVKTDACNPQAALASSYVILTASILVNTIVLFVVYWKFQRKGRLAEFVNAAPGATI